MKDTTIIGMNDRMKHKVKHLPQKKIYRRGYPVAVLVGLEENQAVIWKVFSNVVKIEKTILFEEGNIDAKKMYSFHENVINALRYILNEGVRSVILVSPPRTNCRERFMAHIKSHHAWLFGGVARAVFSQLTGNAITLHDVTLLTRTADFKKIVSETTTHEGDNLLGLLEKRLNSSAVEQLVVYSLEESEDRIMSCWIVGKPKPEYLLLTDSYLSGSRQKSRLQRLIQVAANRGVMTKIIEADSPAGKRLLQLGGLVCILKV
jgi:stalled ribosome rescue protein Dom34